MPYRQEAETVLAMWRDVERQLSDLSPESERADQLIEQWALLRAEHLRLTDAARAHHRPEPEPWPEAAPGPASIAAPPATCDSRTDVDSGPVPRPS